MHSCDRSVKLWYVPPPQIVTQECVDQSLRIVQDVHPLISQQRECPFSNVTLDKKKKKKDRLSKGKKSQVFMYRKKVHGMIF